MLTGALIALLFGAHKVAGTVIKYQARQSIADRNPQAALDWLKWSATVDRLDPEAEFLRARACRKLGEFNLVREHLAHAFKLGYPVKTLEREQVLAFAQAGQMNEAQPHLAGLLTDPQGDAQEICEAFVNGLVLNRRYAEATQMLNSWSADFPSSAQPLYIRGHLQFRMQRYKLAEADFRKALDLDPNHDAAAFELADVLEEQNEPAAALSYYLKAIKSQRFEMQSGVRQSRCLKVLGRIDEARAVIMKVIEKYPDEPHPHQSLGQIELEAGNYQAALEQLDIAAVKLGYDQELRNARGTALRGLKRLDEARREFAYVNEASRAVSRANDLQDNVEVDPSDYKSRYEIGLIYLKYSDPHEGLIWLQSVFNYQPHHRGAHQALADYYHSREAENPKFRELAAMHRKEADAAAEEPEPAVKETVKDAPPAEKKAEPADSKQAKPAA